VPVAVVTLLAGLAGCGTVPPTPAKAEAAASADQELDYSNAWRIEVSEGANSDGELVFRLTPKGHAAQEIRVVIDDGTSEDHVARVIKNAFEDQLDTSRYDIEMDDEEDVLVKKDLTEPRFALAVVSSTVKSVRLRLQKE
jgi:hypothetical protein